ncbi:hypothetical protein HUG17_9262 [Dermatophagoides farinae]|nr:hypothetical protein HUG17_9262 [Dermatophagoides farinae]
MIMMIMTVSAEPQEKKGLFSQMNNWFAKLRGNKDQNNQQNQQDDQKKDEKKEDVTTIRPPMPMGPAAMYPPMPMYGMAAGPAFGPPFAGMVSGGPPMFHSPMTAMSTHQFAAHHHPPAPPPPRHMMHVGPSHTHGFGPFIGGSGGPIFSPYSQPSHLMPIHNDFGDTYGSYGGPYSSEPNDPTETFQGGGPMLGGGGGGPGGHPHHHHHHHHHLSGSNADSMSDSAPGSSSYDDQYNK